MQTLNPRVNAYRPDLAAASLQGRVAATRFVDGRPARVAHGMLDLRRRPEASAPLDTQLLFGEAVMVYDEADGWAWVQNRRDDYVGYVASEGLGPAADAPATHKVAVLRSFLYPAPDLKAPPRDALSFLSPLRVLGTREGFAETPDGWVYARHLAPIAATAPDYVATALLFLGVPYLWGGRSSLGLDCSALVQLALDHAGRPCPRDTGEQEQAFGPAIASNAEVPTLRRGDLVFFPGHVAIGIDATTVVHANAGAMLTTIEDLSDLVARVKVETGGVGVTSVRRPVLETKGLAEAGVAG